MEITLKTRTTYLEKLYSSNKRVYTTMARPVKQFKI